MKYYFRYYLHDHDPRAELDDKAEFLLTQQFDLAEPLRDGSEGKLTLDIAKEILEVEPFYEVTLMCQYDDKTKQVSILNAKS